jgi:hypothetical protein
MGMDPHSDFPLKRFFIDFPLCYQIFVSHIYCFIIITLDLVSYNYGCYKLFVLSVWIKS